MSGENINITLNELKPSVRKIFEKSAYDFDNSGTINSTSELYTVLIAAGASEKEDILQKSTFSKISSDSSKIDNFINNVDWGDRQRILEDSYNKIENLYKKAKVSFGSIAKSSVNASNYMNELQESGDENMLDLVSKELQDSLKILFYVKEIVELQTNCEFSSSLPVLKNIMRLTYKIDDIKKEIKDKDDDAKRETLKQFANELNQEVTRYCPPNFLFPDGRLINVPAFEGNETNACEIMGQYEKFCTQDLEKLEQLKNKTKIEKKDILDIYENTGELTLNIIRQAIDKAYTGQASSISDLEVSGTDFTYSVDKVLKETVSGQKIWVIECKKVENGEVKKITYNDMQGRTVNFR